MAQHPSEDELGSLVKPLTLIWFFGTGVGSGIAIEWTSVSVSWCDDLTLHGMYVYCYGNISMILFSLLHSSTSPPPPPHALLSINIKNQLCMETGATPLGDLSIRPWSFLASTCMEDATIVRFLTTGPPQAGTIIITTGHLILQSILITVVHLHIWSGSHVSASSSYNLCD